MDDAFAEGERLFTFALIADSHVTEEEAAAIGGYDVDTVKLSVARSRFVVEEINRLAPDFVVHLGDITHPEPGTPAYEQSAERFHSVYNGLGCPLYFVAGNHDIGEKAFPGEPLTEQQARLTVNDDMIAEYERHFHSHYYSFEHENCLFVVINGMIVNSGLPCETAQRRWLEALLEEHRDRRVFLFSHYPAYLSRPDESDHYDATDEPGRSWLLGLLERYGIEAFFAGHVHNFFFNRHGETRCYVLPSTCFLRHDYHELFRIAPGMKQGRHDAAKLGYAVVYVHRTGHLHHTIRTYGRALEQDETPEPDRNVLPPVHALKPGNRGIGLSLRQPWCESADIPTPWGLDVFSRKYIRNDYPLMALWEMGVRDLRIPLDDLADDRTRARILELSASGHRFTAYSHGVPKGKAREALEGHGHHLTFWEVVAPVTGLSSLLHRISELKAETPVLFNAFRSRQESFSGSHGLEPDAAGLVDSILSLDGTGVAIDGLVFGVDRESAPAPAIASAGKAVEDRAIRAVVHIQSVHRRPKDVAQTRRHDANRIAEAVTGAMAHDAVAVVLDNFTGIDRGYYFSGGLVDRLYNPQEGARIVRNLHAALAEGCRLGQTLIEEGVKCLEIEHPAGAMALLLPDGPIDMPGGLADRTGAGSTMIDLVTGAPVAGRLAGPTLVVT